MESGPLGTPFRSPRRRVGLLVALCGCLVVLPVGAGQAATAVSFSAPTHYAGGGAVATGDFNRDGDLDLAIARQAAGVAIRLGGAGGSFGAATTYHVPQLAQEVQVGDFNGDHDLDLVVMANRDPDDLIPLLPGGRLLVLLGGPGASFGAPTTVATTDERFGDVAVGDFNGDGDPDLAWGERREFRGMLLGGPGASFTGGPGLLGFGFNLQVADFNRDGDADVAGLDCCEFLGAFVLLGVSGEAFRFIPTPALEPTALAVGDFNRDGKPDLAVGLADPGVPYQVPFGRMLLGSGNGQFGAPTEFDIGVCCAAAMATGDFNGDSDPELVVANYAATRNVSVLQGGPGASLGAPARFLANSGPSAVAVGDFNRDAKPDLVVANDAKLSILLNRTGLPPTSRDVVLEDAPQGYWRFGEPSGNVATDELADNPGRYTGGFTLGRPGILAGDSAARLNGTTGYVRVPDSASLHSGDSFSLELWLKRDKLSTSVHPEGLFLKGYQLYLDANGQIVLRKPLVREIARSRTKITDTTQFHHVVATKSGRTVHIYIDGIDVTGPVTNATITDTNNVLAIGAGANTFRGTLDEAAVYDHPLTPAQVTTHFHTAR